MEMNREHEPRADQRTSSTYKEKERPYKEYPPKIDVKPLATTPTLDRRNPAQIVCLVMGVTFIVIGLAGFVIPDLFNMHLSATHNMIHIASGIASLWFGSSLSNVRAERFSFAFGIFYGLLGVAGFLFGSPGVPSVGNGALDGSLIKIVPGALELGIADHVVHVLISAVFIAGALLSRRLPRRETPTYH